MAEAATLTTESEFGLLPLWNLADLKRVKWQGPEVLTPGKHVLEFNFKYDGLGMGTLAFGSPSGIGRGGTGVLKVVCSS